MKGNEMERTNESIKSHLQNQDVICTRHFTLKLEVPLPRATWQTPSDTFGLGFCSRKLEIFMSINNVIIKNNKIGQN
jgi:hypothetical protein